MAFVYMWHPESMHCFDDHLGTGSTFSSTRNGTQWTTTITLKYWTASRKFAGDTELVYHKSLGAKELSPIKTPKSLKIDPALELIPGSSSVILSTNSFGDFGQCSVISEIVREDEMVHACETAKDIWQKFIHQPQSARNLIYLVLLGCTCEAMAEQYEEAAISVTEAISVDVSEISNRGGRMAHDL